MAEAIVNTAGVGAEADCGQPAAKADVVSLRAGFGAVRRIVGIQSAATVGRRWSERALTLTSDQPLPTLASRRLPREVRRQAPE